MQTVRAALLELWRLFVDDGSLAAVLVVWIGVVAVVHPFLPLSAEGKSVLLFVGFAGALIENVMRTGRRR